MSNPNYPEGVTEQDIDNSDSTSEEEDESIETTVERLKIENLNMRKILRDHQWGWSDENRCIVCKQSQSIGHHKDCFLAWVLK